jgi:hypothetical protein
VWYIYLSYMIPYFRTFVSRMQHRLFNVPPVVTGRWKLDEPKVAFRKSDMSTEDHCGCDEMRIKYLHAKEELEELIEKHKDNQN